MKIVHFYHFDSDPRSSAFLLYVRWKSRVPFVRRCFRDGSATGYWYFYCFCSNEFHFLCVLEKSCVILLWHSLYLLYNSFVFASPVN